MSRYGVQSLAFGLMLASFATLSFSQSSVKSDVSQAQAGTEHIKGFDLPVSALSSRETQEMRRKAGNYKIHWDTSNLFYILTVACPIDRFANAAAQRACLAPLIAQLRKRERESIQHYRVQLRARHAIEIEETRLGGVLKRLDAWQMMPIWPVTSTQQQ